MKNKSPILSVLLFIGLFHSALPVTAMEAPTDQGPPRIALVIGNGAYSSIGVLPNPPADARLIASTLEDLRFDTYLSIDSDQREMKQQIADFGRRLRASGKDTVGFFYYAGHGVQAEGRNYLLPVEATPSDKADLDLMGVEANWVLRQMESAGNRTNIIVLDACRNNPFVSSNRSLGRGLAQIDAPTGSFISYATAPGKVALDGDLSNSPFTATLAKELPTPGLPIEQIFKRVRVGVIKATRGKQIPWDSSSLVDDLIMQPVVKAPSTKAVEDNQAELELWQSVSTSNNTDRIAMFLQIYPNGSRAIEARSLLIENLMKNSESSIEPAKSTISDASPNSAKLSPPVQAEDTVELAANSEDELEVITQAQVSGLSKDYKHYLELFPDGTFADLANAEIKNYKPATPSSLAPTEKKPAVAEAPTKIPTHQERPISMDTPLSDSIEYTGQERSIRELSKGSPLYAPIEGLDASYWKNQQCSNCHAWDQTTLCKQGTFYMGTESAATQRIEHPYGGFFKNALRLWASNECH